MLFPRGNYQQGSNSNSIAAYLQLCDLDREESRWGLTTNFKLTVVNQRDERESSNSGQHRPLYSRAFKNAI
jgi:hypothetical protein